MVWAKLVAVVWREWVRLQICFEGRTNRVSLWISWCVRKRKLLV